MKDLLNNEYMELDDELLNQVVAGTDLNETLAEYCMWCERYKPTKERARRELNNLMFLRYSKFSDNDKALADKILANINKE